MTISALSALRAIGAEGADAVSKAAPGTAAATTGAAKGPDFATVLSNMTTSGINSIETGEKTALAGMQGQASVQQVVEAVMSAEQSLQAAIAVRDKVVAAYQEITRMAI